MKDLLNTDSRLTEWKFLVLDLSQKFLNTGITDKTLQKSWKKDFFRQILKSLASMNKRIEDTQDQISLINQCLLFVNQLRNSRNIKQFQISTRMETGKELS